MPTHRSHPRTPAQKVLTPHSSFYPPIPALDQRAMIHHDDLAVVILHDVRKVIFVSFLGRLGASSSRALETPVLSFVVGIALALPGAALVWQSLHPAKPAG
jgi:hypothetical protein